MFTLLIRKMMNTRWMVLCLFLGFLMAAGMMSTVPIYMDASLQRMLIKDMERYQLDTGVYPGRYTVTIDLPFGVKTESQLELLDSMPSLVQSRVDRIGVPSDSSKTVVSDNLLYLVRGASGGGSSSVRARLSAMTGIEEHITITEGRMYSDTGIAPDGSFEVIMDETALKTFGIICGGTYTIRPIENGPDFKVTVTGTFRQSDENDVYWSETMDGYMNSIFMPADCYRDNVLAAGLSGISNISVYYTLDYHSVDMNRIGSITAAIDEDAVGYAEAGYGFEMGVRDILGGYVERAESLTRILWAIQIPTMVMLAFYLFMVSQLNVEQERNEIAVLKSRGARPRQILGLYGMEMGLLGLITLVTAPFIGLLLCQFLGVSNGFLEFVNRTGISAKITLTSVLYALIAVAVFFVTTMLPIIPASRLTIVQYKQSKTKVSGMSLWEKCGVDLILIGGSIAFYILYSNNINQQVQDGTFTATGQVDPLIFIFATCLVMGLGLLFVRLYPYFLKLIYRIGRPFWTPAQYMSLTSVSCSGGSRERFLMLFLVLTFSLGLFSANTARTINNNKEDMIYYRNGTDVTLTEYWIEENYTVNGSTTTEYVEKDFSRFENLAGVETATRVLKKDDAKARIGSAAEDEVTVMAIEPDKFARTAWFRDDLLPIHWYNYCNALTNYMRGVLVSTSLAEKYDLQLGDEISLKWSGNEFVRVTVLAVIDYWPGISPNEKTSAGQNKPFAVMNYNYAYNSTALEPYQVWIALKDGATSQALYNDIREKRIPIETIIDSSQLLIEEKTDPQLQGMNGGLTLSFIIIMIMAIIGFLIYWILSIKSRTLQFGILRAMGVTFREIIGMLGYEQILVSGVSIAAAFVIGGVVSDVLVPLFQSMYNVEDQIPPFLVTAAGSDYIKIYLLIAVMLLGGFAILGGLIKKININKALKLGED